MHEYVNVSVSSYDPASLAAKLTEKSAEGWEVVAIVPTGGDVTAFLRRAAGASSGAMAAAAEPATFEPAMAESAPMPTSSYEPAPSPSPSPSPEPSPSPSPEPVATYEPAPSPVAEPAGWAVAPEPTPASSAPATIMQGMNDTSANQGYTPAAAQAPEHASAPAAQATTPAGWYHDPSGRFELRYWDGGQWTEHVARAGQQYTDPPVA